MRHFPEHIQHKSRTRLLTGFATWGLLVLATSLVSSASCLKDTLAHLDGDAPHPIHRYLTEDFAQKNPVVARALQGKAIDRWKRSKDPVWQKVFDSIAACLPPAKCDFYAESKKVDMHIVVSTQGDVLEVRIKNIQLMTAKKTVLDYGRRPEGLNIAFANLFGSMMGGIAKNLETASEIKTIRIVGGTVVNQPLSELLERYGFRKLGDIKKTEAVALGGESLPSFKSQKTAYTAGLADRDVGQRPQTGKDWILDIAVKKQRGSGP